MSYFISDKAQEDLDNGNWEEELLSNFKLASKVVLIEDKKLMEELGKR